MSVTVHFPAISKDPNAEGVLATWFVRTGERVNAGHIIAEVMVDKVSMDIEAPVAGVVRLLCDEEATVRQGDAIAEVDDGA